MEKVKVEGESAKYVRNGYVKVKDVKEALQEAAEHGAKKIMITNCLSGSEAELLMDSKLGITDLQFQSPFNSNSDAGLESFFKAVGKNTTLGRLKLETACGDTSENLFLQLQNNTTLKHLDLSPGIQTISTKALELMLENNSTLTYLNLSDKRLDIRSSDKLAKLLGQNTSLLSLNLSNTRLDEDGVGLIFKELKENKTLKDLNLSQNAPQCIIDNLDTFIALIKGNTGLQTLSLRNIHVREIEALMLLEALKANNTLTKLELTRDNIQIHSSEGILEKMRKDHLRRFEIEGDVQQRTVHSEGRDVIVLSDDEDDVGTTETVYVGKESETVKVEKIENGINRQQKEGEDTYSDAENAAGSSKPNSHDENGERNEGSTESIVKKADAKKKSDDQESRVHTDDEDITSSNGGCSTAGGDREHDMEVEADFDDGWDNDTSEAPKEIHATQNFSTPVPKHASKTRARLNSPSSDSQDVASSLLETSISAVPWLKEGAKLETTQADETSSPGGGIDTTSRVSSFNPNQSRDPVKPVQLASVQPIGNTASVAEEVGELSQFTASEMEIDTSTSAFSAPLHVSASEASENDAGDRLGESIKASNSEKTSESTKILEPIKSTAKSDEISSEATRGRVNICDRCSKADLSSAFVLNACSHLLCSACFVECTDETVKAFDVNSDSVQKEQIDSSCPVCSEGLEGGCLIQHFTKP